MSSYRSIQLHSGAVEHAFYREYYVNRNITNKDMYTLDQVKHLLFVYYGLEKDSQEWRRYVSTMKSYGSYESR